MASIREVSMPRFKVVGTLILLVSLAVSFPASGGPFRFMGYDSYSMGQGGAAHGAYGGGLGVLYSNPALLTDLDDQFGVTFVIFAPQLKARLMPRPTNADVPITFYDSDVGIQGSNLDRPLPTAELPNARANNVVGSPSEYVGVGLIHSLGIPKFKLGLSLMLPTAGLASVGSQFADEREQYFSNTTHFALFGEWSKVFSILGGAAYQPLPWMSFGVAVEGALAVGADLNMYIPEATVQDYALVNADVKATPSFRAIVGTAFKVLDLLSFSLVWRDRRFSRVDATATLGLWNYHEPGDVTRPKRVFQKHTLDLDYEPMEVSLSAGVRWWQLQAQATVTWNHWAEYWDTHHQRPKNSALYDLDQPNADAIRGRFAFSDTFSFELGVSWQFLPGYTASLGAGYHPSPVPAQVGRTSYLDNDLLDIAVGQRIDLNILGQVLRLDVGLQFWKMLDAKVYKDPGMIKDEFPDDATTLVGGEPMPEALGLQTNNPGFPGFSFGGFAVVGTLSASYLF
jgi:hypothetical protein